jgi:hypothetical protein
MSKINWRRHRKRAWLYTKTGLPAIALGAVVSLLTMFVVYRLGLDSRLASRPKANPVHVVSQTPKAMAQQTKAVSAKPLPKSAKAVADSAKMASVTKTRQAWTVALTSLACLIITGLLALVLVRYRLGGRWPRKPATKPRSTPSTPSPSPAPAATQATPATPAQPQAKRHLVLNIVTVMVILAIVSIALNLIANVIQSGRVVVAYESTPEFDSLRRVAVRLPYPDSTGKIVYTDTIHGLKKKMFIVPPGCNMGWRKGDIGALIHFRDPGGTFDDGPGAETPNNFRKAWVIVSTEDGEQSIDFTIVRDAQGPCRQNPVSHKSG